MCQPAESAKQYFTYGIYTSAFCKKKIVTNHLYLTPSPQIDICFSFVRVKRCLGMCSLCCFFSPHPCLQAKAIMLCSELFSVENGLLTPTFKLKRIALKSKFMETFVKLYNQLPS